ncbi:MAG: helix-turn-helix domain-containing protein [Sulfuritalea sp.]|jgi:DNA-binding transcriptional ArsR family regulator|nr:helix-turn-helix domain-containing protein [Sulfuritalea sp.]
MNNTSVVKALAALAQESRLAIYRTLVEVGPSGMPAGKISESTGIAPSSLSFHMKELTYSNLVTSRHESRFVIYSANFSTMNEVLGFLTENCCGGNPCVSTSTQTCLINEEQVS